MTTVNITKVATIINDNSVKSIPLTSLNNMVFIDSQLRYTGMLKPAKMDKYRDVLLKKGYVIDSTEWINNAELEGENSDVVIFNMILKRK